MTRFQALCIAVLATLVGISVLPVYAPQPFEPRYYRPAVGSGAVNFYDVAFGIDARVTFAVIDDNAHGGDRISVRYSNAAGDFYMLGLPTGISPWDEGTNILGSVVRYTQSTGRMTDTFAVVGKVTATSGGGMPALDTLVLFVFDENYVQMWYGAGITWTPLNMGYPPTPTWAVISGNIVMSLPPPV